MREDWMMSEVTATPRELVAELVAAENDCDRNRADKVLAATFLGITRASGVEQNRAQLLDQIAHSPNNVLRKLEESIATTYAAEGFALVQSIIQVTASVGTPQGRYRNLHAFERQNRRWSCVAWQVTKLDPASG
jgi:hypothetical protein